MGRHCCARNLTYNVGFCTDTFASGSGGFFSFECAFAPGGFIPRSMLSTIVLTLFPFAMILVFYLTAALPSWITCKGAAHLRRLLHICTLSAFYVSYIDITRTVLQIVHCTKVDQDTPASPDNALSNYWVNDTDVKCYEGHHLVLFLIVTLPVVMLVSLGMPLMLLFRLAPSKYEHDPSVETYGFLYQSYRKGYLYWEAVIMLRKGILAAIAVFSRILGENLQGLMSQAVLVVFVIIHQVAGPFVTDGPNLNRMESASLLCSTLAFFVGLLFNDPNVSQSGRSAISAMFIVIMTTTLFT